MTRQSQLDLQVTVRDSQVEHMEENPKSTSRDDNSHNGVGTKLFEILKLSGILHINIKTSEIYADPGAWTPVTRLKTSPTNCCDC
jgi:hypothetical protein